MVNMDTKALLKRKDELLTEIKRSKITLRNTIDELNTIKKNITRIEDDIHQNEIHIKNINKKLGIRE